MRMAELHIHKRTIFGLLRPPRQRAGRLRVGVLAGALVLVVAACGGEGESSDDSAEPTEGAAGGYFEGKTIEWMVPGSPGGGQDTLARFLAPYLQKQLGDDVSVEVQNVTGGGGATAANEFVAGREPDGLTILQGFGSLHIGTYLETPGWEIDILELAPLWFRPTSTVMTVAGSTGIQSIEDLLDYPETLRIGLMSAESSRAPAMLALELMDVDFEPVYGYEGTAEMVVGQQQGELDIDSQGLTGYVNNVEPLVETGEIVPLFTHGKVENGEVIGDPYFTDLPTVADILEDIEGTPPSGEAWEAYVAMVTVTASMTNILWTHGDAPQEAIDELRAAFARTLEDEDYQAKYADIIGTDEPVVGEEGLEEVMAQIEEIWTNEETKRWTIDWLVENYDAEPR